MTFAPGELPAERELQHLESAYTEPALLRRAWLELELQRPQQALETAARVIYAEQPPSAHTESFARYLRAEAFRRQGHPERGAFDLQRARELAMDPELQRRLLPATLTPQPAGLPWGDVAVQPRDSWQPIGANRTNLDRMQRPRRVTIHHSAMYFRDTRPQAAAAQIARIQRQHMRDRNFGDIGYHFLIDPSGRVWEGRELHWQGAHASGSNNVANIGICLLGNFVRQRDGQGPSPAQVRSMERLVVNLMRHYRMRGDALFCHSDFKSTQCPGPRMAPIVRQFARQLQARGHFVAAGEEDE
ncbi:MAG: N-acetylmuramoyl-L-alanine amidase [Planctomycetes bacterium]|nr:N-acetylmuramoyl-L-alanine amidase [Planctomycetota bacterium]